jgi:prephenate dehydrogenase
MDVLIVGAGEMGRWFGDTLASTAESLVGDADDTPLELAFCDRDRAVAETAASATGPSARALSLDSNRSFDLVCLAVPLSVVADAVETHADQAETALVDVTGELATPLEAMAEHAPGRERASLHPLFAAENAPGRIPIAVGSGGPTIDRLCDALEAAGNSLFETTPATHDEAMETIQGAAHAAILAYAIAAEPVPEGFETPVSAALDDLVAQVTGNDPDVYAEIQSRFAGADRVATAASRLVEADRDAFETLYETASERGPVSEDGGES